MPQQQPEVAAESISWQNFLVNSPPGKMYRVAKATSKMYQNAFDVNQEDLFDYCDSQECKGRRFFRLIDPSGQVNGRATIYYSSSSVYQLIYKCKNCNEFQRVFVIDYALMNEESSDLTKIGQLPAFGPPIPTRAISLVGEDRELFLKGRRAENQGLGIAAFAYYRRIVEGQWHRFLDQIVEVGGKTGLDADILKQIENAKQETQFSKAVASMGEAIPPSLKLNGQNPITLLYSALSEGIHAQSDQECLELAGHIRIIIYELAERLNLALQEHNELDAAVKRLASRKNQQGKL